MASFFEHPTTNSRANNNPNLPPHQNSSTNHNNSNSNHYNNNNTISNGSINSNKRCLEQLENSPYFKIRAFVNQLRALIIQACTSPKLDTCEARHGIQERQRVQNEFLLFQIILRLKRVDHSRLPHQSFLSSRHLDLYLVKRMKQMLPKVRGVKLPAVERGRGINRLIRILQMPKPVIPKTMHSFFIFEKPCLDHLFFTTW